MSIEAWEESIRHSLPTECPECGKFVLIPKYSAVEREVPIFYGKHILTEKTFYARCVECDSVLREQTFLGSKRETSNIG